MIRLGSTALYSYSVITVVRDCIHFLQVGLSADKKIPVFWTCRRSALSNPLITLHNKNDFYSKSPLGIGGEATTEPI